MVNKFTSQPTIKEVAPKINEVIDAMGTVKSVNSNSPDANGNVSITIPTVPTKLSQFTDDLGSSPNHTHSQYLTSVPSHNQATSTINALTSYNKSVSGGTGALSTSDTLNKALAKLENALDGKQASGSYATTSDISDMATKTWVGNQGYTTNVGTVTKVNNTSPDSNGNVSITIPTVNNATLTIQKNGTTVKTFTANASSNVTANITVPTAISGLTDDTATTPIAKATTATKLGSSNVGSATQPIYLSSGTATACTYTLEKSVPSNAVFTDTTYSVMTGAGASSAGASGLVPAPASGDNTKFLRGDGTWQTVSSGGSGANIDLSNLSATGKRVMDGGIVAKYAVLETATSPNSRDVDLSSYLPSNDTYLVYIRILAEYKSSGSSYGIGNVRSPYTNRATAEWFLGTFVGQYARYSYIYQWVPITNKTLYSQIADGALNSGGIYAYGYRLVGTNS